MTAKHIAKDSQSHSILEIRSTFLQVIACAFSLLLLPVGIPTDMAHAKRAEMIAEATVRVPVPTSDTPTSSHSIPPQSMATIFKPPLQFEPNLGQTDSQVSFIARGTGYTVFLTPTEAVLVLSAGAQQDAAASSTETTFSQTQQVVQLQVLEANPKPVIRGVDEIPTIINRLSGSDPTRWQTHVPAYAQVRYEAMYPGIDLLYYGNQHQLEYDFIVHPGADPAAITLGIQGADHATLEEDGHLLLSLPGGTLRLQKPVLSQTTTAGDTTNIPGSFLLLEPDPANTTAPPIQVAFAVGAYDPALPLIIDPLVNYASAFGGEGQDQGEAIAVDNNGHGYIVGTTDSMTFPVTTKAFQDSAIGQDRDVFVTKFDTKTSEILFSTYIGGEGDDRATGVAVDDQGMPYVTGETTSLTFPTQNPLQETREGPSDAFVLKLAADGASLLYSTYLGGSGPDHANAIVVNQEGQASLTGTTTSPNFPTINAIDDRLGSGEATTQSDVFVTTLDAQGATLMFSTLLGGTGSDVGHSLTLDDQGGLYLTGATAKGAGFPVTTDAFQPTYGGGATDAFLAKIHPTLVGPSALLYASYLGGSGEEVGLDLLVDAQQQTFITGWTTGQGHTPTVGAPKRVLSAVAPVNSLSQRNSSPVAVNPESGIRNLMRGLIQQRQAPAPPSIPQTSLAPPAPLPEFPVTPNAYDPTFNGEKDAFLAHVNVAVSGPNGLVYATYVGGSATDVPSAIGLDSLGRLCIGGTTNSPDYPMQNALANQGTLSGGTDGFITKFAPDPSTLLFSSFLGGRDDEIVTDMRLNAKDLAYLTGHTRSKDFPLLTPLNDTTLTGEPHAFIVELQDPVNLQLSSTGITPNPGRVGEPLTIGIRWSNLGPDPATGVQLTVFFSPDDPNDPVAARFVRFENTGGPSQIRSCSGASAQAGLGGDLVCRLGNIPVSRRGNNVSTANLIVVPLVPITSSGNNSDDAEITANEQELDEMTAQLFLGPIRVFGISVSPPTATLNPGESQNFEISGIDLLTEPFRVNIIENNSDGDVVINNRGFLYTAGTTGGVTDNVEVSNGGNPPDIVRVPITINTVAVQRMLTVIKNGSGSGTVTSAPTGINCGSDCLQSYDDSITVSLIARPDSDSIFSRFSGVGCSSTNTDISVVMTQDRSCTATFISRTVTVPNVVGQTLANASAAIRNVTGLSLGALTQANSATVLSGIVISQNPGPGQAASGSTVDFVVSLGPVVVPPVTVPNVVGQTQAAATATINDVMGLNVSGVTQANNATVPFGTVISQNPGPGPAPSGSTVTLVVSSGTDLLVTTLDDGPDATPGDGVCDTGVSVCTLRAAIQEANAIPGDQTITLPPGTYPLTVTGANEDRAATGDLDITDDVLIESTTKNAADVVITANALDRVFDIPPGSRSSVTLRGLTIQEGVIVGSTGGGLRNAQSTVIMEDCVVTENQSNGSGGGISHLGGTLTVRNTMITNNTSRGLGGGLHAQDGTVTIEATTRFTDNTANFGGGLSTGGADVTLINTRVENNTAVGGGGGIYKFLSPGDLLGSIQAPRVALSNTTVRNNTINDCEGRLVNAGNNNIGTTNTRCMLLSP